jgi:DHA1 family multidrug resistance protein-like MFS transporter
MFLRLSAVAFLAYCSYALCRAPLLPLFARDLGATPQMVGLVVAASTLTGVLLKLPAGAWSDVLGRRPLLIAGAMVFAIMPFTYLVVGSLAALVALRFVHGSATAIFGPVASASVSDLAPAARRGAWLSTYAAVQGTGQAIGPIVGGYLIAIDRYDLAFLVAGALAAVTPLLVAGWPVAARARTPETPAPRAQMAAGIRDVLRTPLIVATSLAQAAQFLMSGALNAFLPIYAHEVVGVPLH